MAESSSAADDYLRAAAEVDSPQAREARQRHEIFTYALGGVSTRQIAEQIGRSEAFVRDVIDRSLARVELQDVQSLRNMENARLDRMQAAIWGAVQKGDLKAIAAYLKISDQRSKLNGLYAPTKVSMTMEIRKEMDDAFSALERMVLNAEGVYTREGESNVVSAGPGPVGIAGGSGPAPTAGESASGDGEDGIIRIGSPIDHQPDRPVEQAVPGPAWSWDSADSGTAGAGA